MLFRSPTSINANRETNILLLATSPHHTKYHQVYSKKKSGHPKIHSILLHSNSCQGALSGFDLALSKDDLTKTKKNKNKNKNNPHFCRSRTQFCPDLIFVGLPSYYLEVPKWVFTPIQGFFIFGFFEFLPLFYRSEERRVGKECRL